MMSAFDIHKNLIAVLGALTLALLLGASPDAYADDTRDVLAETAATYDFVFGDGDMDELRELLSNPELSDEQRRILRRTLDTVHEEIA